MKNWMARAYDIISMLPEHIRSKITVCPDTQCWLFKSNSPSSNGYERCWLYGNRVAAHRAVYELITGRDIREWQLDHTCEVRNCVNPKHMDEVTPKINCKRKFKRRKRPKVEED